MVDLGANEGVRVTERVSGRALAARSSSSVGVFEVEHVLHVLRVASSIDADQKVQRTVVVTVATSTVESVEVLLQSRTLGNGTTYFTRFGPHHLQWSQVPITGCGYANYWL